MSDLYTGSICLSELNAAAKAGDKAFARGKNGKIYCNIAMWINDEPDQYGNDGSLQLGRTKEDSSPKVYFGHVKKFSTEPKPVSQEDLANELIDEEDEFPI